MTRFVLVRHGETEKNAKGKMHRQKDPEELNATGREQMYKTATRLQEFAPLHIYTSLEKRATQSGEILSKVLKTGFEPIMGLQERNWGFWSGKPWGEIQAILNSMSFSERYFFLPPQGESWLQFEERLKNSILPILESNPEKTIVVVTHARAIRALLRFLKGASLEEGTKFEPENASVTIFEYSQGQLTEVIVNDISHL